MGGGSQTVACKKREEEHGSWTKLGSGGRAEETQNSLWVLAGRGQLSFQRWKSVDCVFRCEKADQRKTGPAVGTEGHGRERPGVGKGCDDKEQERHELGPGKVCWPSACLQRSFWLCFGVTHHTTAPQPPPPPLGADPAKQCV